MSAHRYHHRWRRKKKAGAFWQPSSRHWRAAHPDLYTPAPASGPPKLLQIHWLISNEFWSATCLWIRRDNVWAPDPTSLPPILSWMKGKDRHSVKLELLRRGCSWLALDPLATTSLLPSPRSGQELVTGHSSLLNRQGNHPNPTPATVAPQAVLEPVNASVSNKLPATYSLANWAQ